MAGASADFSRFLIEIVQAVIRAAAQFLAYLLAGPRRPKESRQQTEADADNQVRKTVLLSSAHVATLSFRSDSHASVFETG